MAKAYLIGGAPRTGKTSLALQAITAQPMLAVSTDALRYALRQIILPANQPDLFALEHYASDNPTLRTYMRHNLANIVAIQNRESIIVWQAAKHLIMSNIADGYDVLVEGTAVLPSFLAELDCEFNAIFIGNQSAEHFDTTLQSARDNRNDWMHRLDAETIEVFYAFNQVFSEYLEDESKLFKTKYIEIHDGSFATDMNGALAKLLQN